MVENDTEAPVSSVEHFDENTTRESVESYGEATLGIAPQALGAAWAVGEVATLMAHVCVFAVIAAVFLRATHTTQLQVARFSQGGVIVLAGLWIVMALPHLTNGFFVWDERSQLLWPGGGVTHAALVLPDDVDSAGRDGACVSDAISADEPGAALRLATLGLAAVYLAEGLLIAVCSWSYRWFMPNTPLRMPATYTPPAWASRLTHEYAILGVGVPLLAITRDGSFGRHFAAFTLGLLSVFNGWRCAACIPLMSLLPLLISLAATVGPILYGTHSAKEVAILVLTLLHVPILAAHWHILRTSEGWDAHVEAERIMVDEAAKAADEAAKAARSRPLLTLLPVGMAGTIQSLDALLPVQRDLDGDVAHAFFSASSGGGFTRVDYPALHLLSSLVSLQKDLSRTMFIPSY